MTRALLVTADPSVHEEVLRLAAVAGTEVDVAASTREARLDWERARIVLVGDDVLDALLQAGVPRRAGVHVLGRDLDDATVWQRAVSVGAERVVFLPDGEAWLVEQLAEAAEVRATTGPLVAVVGGRGGAGATTLACALALAAVRRGSAVALVDADPLGGGIDVVLGQEHASGLRWPELAGTRGRVPSAALSQALPRMHDLAVLSWDRGDPLQLTGEAVRAVLAAARRGHDLVVADLPRSFDVATREALTQAATTLVLVPAEVRATAAAARVASRVAQLCADVRVVVRGPSPAGVTAAQIQQALRLPLAGELRPEPGLARSLEEGTPPGLRRGSPLATLCQRLVDDLAPVRRAAAA